MTITRKANHKSKTVKSKTVKSKPAKTVKTTSNPIKSKIVVKMMEVLTIIKLYHWKTKVFSQHKASDELHSNLSENIDKFIEVLLGKDESRIRIVGENIRFVDSIDQNDFKRKIFNFRAFLIELNRTFDSAADSDLLNIRDEMLANINQFLYLMTFE
jgi:hypothetical protein